MYKMNEEPMRRTQYTPGINVEEFTAVIFDDANQINSPISIARDVVMESKFDVTKNSEKRYLTETFNSAILARNRLDQETTVLLTTLGDYDPAIPSTIPFWISRLLKRADVLGKPIAYVTDHPEAERRYDPVKGDILIPGHNRDDIEKPLHEWLGLYALAGKGVQA
jgi:hypothetical protein